MAARRLLLLLLLASPQSPARATLDVPAMLYTNREQGKSTPLTLLPPEPLPASLADRLASASTERAPVFADLSPPLQRALLWDAGLVLASDGAQYVQLKTKCGKSMSDIFVSKDTVVRVANCSLAICNAQILAFAYPNCSAEAMAPQTRCAVVDSDPALAHVSVKRASSLWSEEGVVEDAHNFQLFQYDTSASSDASNRTTTLYTLYQTPDFALASESTCPNKATSFVVPCQTIAETPTTSDASVSKSGWCVPQQGYLVGLWLAEEVNAPVRAADHRKWVQVSTIFIALFALAVLVGVGFAYRAWTKRHRKAPLAPAYYAVLSASGGNTNTMVVDTNTATVGINSTAVDTSAIDRANDAMLRVSHELKAFVHDDELLVCKIEYDALQFDKLIAKGANGEVWRGQYANQFVAIKRLLVDMRSDVRALEIFSREVRLGASLEHPNIVRFLGVSWRRLSELSMVSEFVPMGDLARFLVSNESRALTWKREKLSLAADIAKALVYLHSLVPVIIHRDLKSLNVLLTAAFEAKLSDFGLSRERSFEETMTMGVGTLLWTAPEVLRGDRYSEKADIYSYGIVLSELDTCLPPYSLNDELGGPGADHGDHSETPGRRRAGIKSVELLPLIRNGKITPQFRADCPPAVLTLARACLDQDPDKRPNAMQLVYLLQSKISMSL